MAAETVNHELGEVLGVWNDGCGGRSSIQPDARSKMHREGPQKAVSRSAATSTAVAAVAADAAEEAAAADAAEEAAEEAAAALRME